MPEAILRTMIGPDGSPAVRPGESPQEPLRKSLADWAGWPVEDVEVAAAAVEAFIGEVMSRSHEDKLVSAVVRDRLERRVRETQQNARVALDPILGAGLEAREGRFVRRFLLPDADPSWRAWKHIQSLLKTLGVERTQCLCVCGSCTAVFRPRGRKTSARYCPKCDKHPSDAPVMGMPGTMPLQRGDRTRIMLPIVDLKVSTVVTGFREVTIGRCAECGDLFDGRSDKKFCEKKACRQAYHRRRRPRAEGPHG